MPFRIASFRFVSLPLTAVLVAHPAIAQDIDDRLDQADQIIVTAERIKGSVDTDVPPVEELGEDEVAALGASSITDVVAALGPQTSSGRGRGGGGPIVLLNGQRVSGFRELRNIPPEAIRRVQVFPEEVALQYGYRPDQRVINFILKENFASFDQEFDVGLPQDGGFTTSESETTFTSFGKNTRLNLNAEYERQGLLTQAERNITADSNDLRFEFDGDINDFRSLRAATDRFEVNGTFSKTLAPQTNFSVNANYQLVDSLSLLGLPSASLLLPGTSPFSPDGNNLTISRYYNSPRPLERKNDTHTANFGFSFNSILAGWRWALTGDYSHVVSNTRTTRNADFTNLQTGLLNGSLNPFADGFGDDLSFISPDIAESTSQNLDVANTFNGTLFDLPAGPVQMTFRAGFQKQVLDGLSTRSGLTSLTDLDRKSVTGAINMEFPLLERDVGALGFLGDVAINGNFGYSDLSDFGGLIEYTAGIRWSPLRNLTLQASLIGDENAPGISQLGNPVQLTPNVTYFDFTRNESALIELISGGNPVLVAEKRRDLKLSANWRPDQIFGIKTDGLNLELEYFRNRSDNTTASFPLLTPEIEAAFASRVTRDANGVLIRVDQRPVNFAEERSERIKWGFNFSGELGESQRRRPDGDQGKGAGSRQPQGGEQAPSARPSDGRPEGTGRARSGGGPGGGGLPGGRRGGRWQIALSHTYQISDTILIAAGVPELDLLNGSATSQLGGTPRHQIELSGGLFNNGLGMRVEGNYRSATRVDGSGLAGSSDLRFSDLTSLNLRFFINLDDRGDLTQKMKFLKGSRVAIRINNVLNDIIDVRDENGAVPLSYQPGFLDPVGRYFEVSFRKRF